MAKLLTPAVPAGRLFKIYSQSSRPTTLPAITLYTRAAMKPPVHVGP